TGLAEDRIGDTDLADVMESTGAVDDRADLLVATERRVKECPVAGDILGMAARVVVLRVDGDDQPLEDVESDRFLERRQSGARDAGAVAAHRLSGGRKRAAPAAAASAAAGAGLVERPRGGREERRDRLAVDREG